MMIETLLTILAMIVLLVLKGFYSGSEIALVNSDKMKLLHRAKHGDKGAQLVLRLYETPETLLSTTLVGTNLATITLTTMGTLMMIDLFGENGDFIAILIFTPLLLILGEIVPKSIMQQKSDTITTTIIYPLKWSSILFSPITYIFSRIARMVARMFGAGDAESSLSIDREQIRAMVHMTERAESARDFDRARITRILRFADTNVAQVMVPVAEMEAVDKDMSTADAIALMRKTGYRRIPIYEGNVSNVVGIFTASPWQMMDSNFLNRPLKDNQRSPLYLNPYQSIDEVLPVLWKDGMEIGIVVDEFGSAIGLLTVEDIIEEVMGERDMEDGFIGDRIRRRHSYEMLDDNVVLMDARMSLSEANEILGVDLPTGEYHTVGGLVLARFRHIPQIGEVITEEGYRFMVAEATVRGIEKLRVEPVSAAKK